MEAEVGKNNGKWQDMKCWIKNVQKHKQARFKHPQRICTPNHV